MRSLRAGLPFCGGIYWRRSRSRGGRTEATVRDGGYSCFSFCAEFLLKRRVGMLWALRRIDAVIGEYCVQMLQLFAVYSIPIVDKSLPFSMVRLVSIMLRKARVGVARMSSTGSLSKRG